MPQISRTVADLTPNTFDPNNSNSQSTWFSYMRTVYSTQHGGIILPPTKTGFMNSWNSQLSGILQCEGNTLEECKNSLSLNVFPFIRYQRTNERNQLKAIAWTRMIMALNMYADVKREFGFSVNHFIDFIGSQRNNSSSFRDTSLHETNFHSETWNREIWKSVFHRRCAIFISNAKLEYLIELSTNGQHVFGYREFWNLIFEIYEQMPVRMRCFQQRPVSNCTIGRTISPTQNITPVEQSIAPVEQNIAQEYMNREDDEEYVPSNQQLVNMIINSDDIPSEIKKQIFEICIAHHMSHPCV